MQTPEKPHIETPPEGIGRGEIVAIVLALMLPAGVLALILIPGAMAAVVGFLLQRGVIVAASSIAALAVAAVLGLRIRMRMRKRKPGAKSDGPPTFWDFWRDPYR